MSLKSTSRANQLHIGIFGKRNSGKSTLINALTGNNTALVSELAGTTTDPEYKPIEIYGIGPCVLIDTAGFDDIGYQGQMRVVKTRTALEKTDIALVVCADEDIDKEVEWINEFKARSKPVIVIINKVDLIRNTDKIRNLIYEGCKEEPIKISAISKHGTEKIREEIIRKLPEDFEANDITGELVMENDLVMLVLPPEIQASKNRLALHQVQLLRELLDKKCVTISCTADKFEEALKHLTNPPKLIIADYQVFPKVYEKKPAESLITSISDLFAAHKEEPDYYEKGASILDNLTE